MGNSLDIPTHVCYHLHMARRTIDPTDPRQLAVQVSIRMPFWYREQLHYEARALNKTVPEIMLDATERIYIPKPPK